VTGRTRLVADSATFRNACGACARFRHAVLGPQESGKSTFLRALSSATYARFAASGQHKRTLFFFVDFELELDAL
jgi:ABC-type hemin transport system ATPase subunit